MCDAGALGGIGGRGAQDRAGGCSVVPAPALEGGHRYQWGTWGACWGQQALLPQATACRPALPLPGPSPSPSPRPVWPQLGGIRARRPVAASPSLKNVFVISAAGQITVTNGPPAPRGPQPIWFDFGLSWGALGPPPLPSGSALRAKPGASVGSTRQPGWTSNLRTHWSPCPPGSRPRLCHQEAPGHRPQAGAGCGLQCV